jgi:DNA-binding response OmpR family regulator
MRRRPTLDLPPDPTTRQRAAWLVLASGGPAADLQDHGPASVRVVADPRRFRDLLAGERPVIVVVCEPPAGPAELDLVARERVRRPSIRIIHIAPPEAVDERLHALEMGFDDALSATVPVTELAGRITLLAARAKARTPNAGLIAIAEDVELDLVAHELRCGGVAVHLRPKEYGLLALLAAHPGRAYTRRQLLDRVWGHDHDSGSRTVDVHIRWLRSKIELHPAHPAHLVTVRGVGYRLDLAPR